MIEKGQTNMLCKLCRKNGLTECEDWLHRIYPEEAPSENEDWGVKRPDIIKGTARYVEDSYSKMKDDIMKGKKDATGSALVSYTEEQRNELVAAQHQRELAREQRKALEESYENARRVEVIEENIADKKRSKLAEFIAIVQAALALLVLAIGIVFGLEHISQLAIPLGLGSIGAAGYKASLGDRIKDRQKEMRKDGLF